jgi:hypothetical protein
MLEIAIAAAAVCLVAAIYAFQAKGRAEKRVLELDGELAEKTRRFDAAAAEADVLRKYQGIADAELAARTVAESARNEADRVLAEAHDAREAAEQLVREAKTQAAREAKDIRTGAEAGATIAAIEAKRIIEEAKQRAETIAGDAIRAMENARELEQTARAMKNVIEGYGNQYILPTAGLLDELADELAFADAGQRLKATRERVRSMVKQETAATCDYAEANRRETAINFVLDAFNGKVESVLADVRHDNYGTLEQKIAMHSVW